MTRSVAGHRAAASFSGVLHPTADASFWLPFFARTGLDPCALWGDPVAQQAIWADHDPHDLAKRLRYTALFISCGDGTAGGPFDQPGRTDSLEALIYGANVAFTNLWGSYIWFSLVDMGFCARSALRKLRRSGP